MSSRYVTYCCDPLQCHKRRRTSGGSYNLRCVPITLIKKFPSLQLTAKHKICPACRIKLYKLPSENVPVAEHCRDAGTSSGAVASVILPSDIVPGQPEDAQVSEVVPASDEMGVETEVSYNAVVSEAVTVSDEFSVETEVPNEVPAPDELGVEAQSGESFDAFITEEGTSQSGNDKSECSWADAECEVIGQLKEKFNYTVKRSEKVRILTILPKSWSVRKIMKEFGASNYMARQAKQLVQEKGILSSPNPKPGKTLSPTIEEHVVAVYLSDDVSRMMPGRKDCVSFMTAEGKRESRQKRLLLCSLKEAYEHLKSLHPSDKVGFSTFASLRPKECVLAGSSAADGIAGTVKRLAAKASLQRPDGNQILNAMQLYEFATSEIPGMSFCYVTSQEYDDEATLLYARFDQSATIRGTQSFHCFKPINTTMVEVKHYSNSTQVYKKRVMKHISHTA
eukprot:Em0007g470a